ncbi:MAG: sugar nucleotide-binding protein [Acidobacteriota bacterium]
MKVVITGANGTVGSVLRDYLQKQGIEVVAWDKKLTPIDDYHQMQNFLNKVKPDILFHLAIASQNTGKVNESWLVNYQWTSELAWITRIMKIKFIYTSTVMVFSDNAKGPFTIAHQADAKEGYGYEKRLAEERVFYQNPDATVVRLGWQIGEKPGSNHMIDYLDRQMRQPGQINASTKWYPACSFITDSVETLYTISRLPTGLYHLDSNERWNFFEIVCALKELHNANWQIVAKSDFVFDQRLIEDKIKPLSLKSRLPSLP